MTSERSLDNLVGELLREDQRFDGKHLGEVIGTPEGESFIDELLLELNRRQLLGTIRCRDPLEN